MSGAEGLCLVVRCLVLGRLGQVDGGLEYEGSVEEVVGVWVLDLLLGI